MRMSSQKSPIDVGSHASSALTSPVELDHKAAGFRFHPYAQFPGWQSMAYANNSMSAAVMPSLEAELDPRIFILPEAGGHVDADSQAFSQQQSPSAYSDQHLPVPPPAPKRKYPPPAACLPCRARKVKCNHLVPCSTCVERDHPEACIYKPPVKKPKLEPVSRASSAAAKRAKEAKSESSDDAWRPNKADWEALTSNISSLRRELNGLRKAAGSHHHHHIAQTSLASFNADSPASSLSDDEDDEDEAMYDETGSQYSSGSTLINGFHATDHLTDVFLGGNSAPALVAALGDRKRNAHRSFLVNEAEMLPAFVLGNESATYPFVDLFTLQYGSQGKYRMLYHLIPDDAECLLLFKCYRDTAHVLFPGVVDVASFETALFKFFSSRQQMSAKPTDQELSSMFEENDQGMHFVGLLLAVLASGSQCSDVSRVTTEPKAQIFSMSPSLTLTLLTF
jgi:Fungal Zn(2)-Cys(6) binuclear cluster domain